MANQDRLGDLLVREKGISIVQLRAAQEEARRTGVTLGYALVRRGAISESEYTAFMSREYNIPAVNLGELEIDADLVHEVTIALCRKLKVIPVTKAGSALMLAMADPLNGLAIDDVKFRTGYNVDPVIASEPAILAALDRIEELSFINPHLLDHGLDEADIEVGASEPEINVRELRVASEEAPVVRLCNALLLEAIRRGASDIHIEPLEKKLRVRMRIDGFLVEAATPPVRLKAAVISRIKIMAELDIAERRKPQDGRIKLKIAGREMDFRVSVLPSLWGEKVVLRLLDRGSLQLDMGRLGFERGALEAFRCAIYQPNGMVLVTGPTGSGKTTTLYSALTELNAIARNICTVEDPIEYVLPGIIQVQVHEGIGLSFAEVLRAFLRQDPNVIMVGEIRDFETAEVAIKAALTGHIVLSTLHTNDAPSTISRLIQMGAEPFLVTASTNLVLAQRLARKVCADCKVETRFAPDVLRGIGFTEEQLRTARLMRGQGCRACNGTGYKGRVALYEVMPFSDELKELAQHGASTAELKAEAIRSGMRTLRMSGIQKCLDGVTTPEEILRVTAGD